MIENFVGDYFFLRVSVLFRYLFLKNKNCLHIHTVAVAEQDSAFVTRPNCCR